VIDPAGLLAFVHRFGRLAGGWQEMGPAS
jgi:hypothetical protein